ncbi:hypothetical protein [Salinarimonas rosea]|uniref:hypothetical protein n=1 Tax=Salinarimonas rosea TaxID=552063 RepID=UPI000490E471|nr:hypothetical protein [Salinarimonas rosea]
MAEYVAKRSGRAFGYRLGSAVVGAASFGLIAAPLLPLPYLTAAIALAFLYGFFFLGGAGYRILIALARRDARAQAPVSWTGGAAASALAAAAAGAMLALAGADGGLLLAAYAVGANVSYVFAKLGCLEAGCCAAARPLPLLGGRDLRAAELAATLAVLALAGAALAAGLPAVAALAGVGGHLVVRIVSRSARDRRPRGVLTLSGTGQELIPLLVVLGVATGLALQGAGPAVID